MNNENYIQQLREALSDARPFVASIADQATTWGDQAKLSLYRIDNSLIQTDPDPMVRELIAQHAKRTATG